MTAERDLKKEPFKKCLLIKLYKTYEKIKSNNLIIIISICAPRSANYNHRLQECRLSADDRYSLPQAFIVSIDTDYLENQCASCKYLQIITHTQYMKQTHMKRRSNKSLLENIVVAIL